MIDKNTGSIHPHQKLIIISSPVFSW